MARHPTISKASDILAEIDALLAETGSDNLTNPARKQLMERVGKMQDQLERLSRKVDPNELPDSFFDPSEPSLIGNFVALALIAQDRKPLATLKRFYGSGIYAIYYIGPAGIYAPISGTETPIYIGKADPQGSPKNVIEQGTKLADRLGEHRKNIEKVEGIEIQDFECRALAVQSGYQAAAESHLIRLFRPIWNNETRILFGIGKHGDSSTTRANNKSPFDTVHPGRAWAAGNPEAKSVSAIHTEVASHFQTATIFHDTATVFEAFVANIKNLDRLDEDDL